METLIKEVPQESKELLVEAETLAANYSTYKIVDNVSLVAADEDLSLIKKKIASLEADRLKITRPMDSAKKMIMDLFSKPITALENARRNINREMTTYRTEQERIRQEQERKLQELARKEEERKKKELEARAAKAEAAGKLEKAEGLRAKKEEVFVPAPVVQSTVAEVKNKPRQVWKYEVVDINAVPREYLTIDDTKTGQVVRATKGTLAIPGLRIYSEDSKF